MSDKVLIKYDIVYKIRREWARFNTELIVRILCSRLLNPKNIVLFGLTYLKQLCTHGFRERGARVHEQQLSFKEIRIQIN